MIHTKKLTSSIITIGEGTTIICNQDELNTPGRDTAFLFTKSKGLKMMMKQKLRRKYYEYSNYSSSK